MTTFLGNGFDGFQLTPTHAQNRAHGILSQQKESEIYKTNEFFSRVPSSAPDSLEVKD